MDRCLVLSGRDTIMYMGRQAVNPSLYSPHGVAIHLSRSVCLARTGGNSRQFPTSALASSGSRCSPPTGFTDTFTPARPLPRLQGAAAGYDLVGVVEETGPGVPAAAHRTVGGRSSGVVGAGQYSAICRALSRAGPRWRRSRRGGVHPAGLSHRLPNAHPLPPPTARSNYPRTRSGRRSARQCSTWRAISA